MYEHLSCRSCPHCCVWTPTRGVCNVWGVFGVGRSVCLGGCLCSVCAVCVVCVWCVVFVGGGVWYVVCVCAHACACMMLEEDVRCHVIALYLSPLSQGLR